MQLTANRKVVEWNKMETNTKRTKSEITEKTQKLGQYYILLQSSYRTGEGDPEELVKLVAEAMGNRSQRQFASDLGVNVSSVSRILNGKVSEISSSLLARIALNADPNSKVTLEKLMAAQGIVESDYRMQQSINTVEKSRCIMANELLKKGYSVSYLTDSSRDSTRVFDFIIQTNSITKGNGIWGVETKMMSKHASFAVGIGKTDAWLDSVMASYYRGEKIGRASLVIENRAVFEQIKEKWKKTYIKDEISIILMSIESGKINDEFILPLIDGSKPKFSFSPGDYIIKKNAWKKSNY